MPPETTQYTMLVEKLEAALAHTLTLKNCRERALVITKLEEAMLWATRMPDRYFYASEATDPVR